MAEATSAARDADAAKLGVAEQIAPYTAAAFMRASLCEVAGWHLVCKCGRCRDLGRLLPIARLVAVYESLRLQSEIGAVDVTLRLFDPEERAATIKPLVKRAKPARFRNGEFTRPLLGLIREADRPLTVRDLAESGAATYGLDASKTAMRTLVPNTRAAMSKPRSDLVRETVDGVYQWRVQPLG